MCCLLAFGGMPVTADDFLSIKFSKRNQVKTGLTWMQFKPKLINGAEVASDVEVLSHKNLTEVTLARVPSVSPYAQVGKLFFTLGDEPGRVANCTGAFSGGGRVVITAAHCVMSLNGHWNDDFVFIRSYGAREQELFAIQCIGILEDWGAINDDGMLMVDYAFLLTNRVNKTGALPFSIDAPPERMKVVGYSDNHRDGRRMLELDIFADISATLVGYTENPLGKGSSGSPWIGGADMSVFTVTSHYMKKDQQQMNGPRLTPLAERLLAFTRNGCNPV